VRRVNKVPEELEALAKDDAIATARRRLDELMTQPGREAS
jgi:hypothetical protein